MNKIIQTIIVSGNKGTKMKPSKAIKLSTDLLGYTVEDDLICLPNGMKMIVPGEDGTEYNQEAGTLDFTDISNNIHTVATEYRVSSMIAWLMMTIGKVKADDILEIGNKFPHHTISVVSEFTKSHSKVPYRSINALQEHGLIRLGIDKINDCAVIAPTVPCTAVKINWLRKRWSYIGSTITDIITNNVLKDNKEVMSVFQLIIIEVANIVVGILSTIDKHLGTDLISEFNEHFFEHSSLKKDKVYISDYYGDYDIEPKGGDIGAILTGMPDARSNSYCINLHKGVTVLLNDRPVKEVKKPVVKEVEKPVVKEVEKPVVKEVEEPTVVDTTKRKLFGKTAKGKLTSNKVPKPVQQFVDQYGNPCDKYGNPLTTGNQLATGTQQSTVLYTKPRSALPPRSNGVTQQVQTQYIPPSNGYGVAPQVRKYGVAPQVQKYTKPSNGYGVAPQVQPNPAQQFVDQYGNPCDRYGNPVVVQQPNPVQQLNPVQQPNPVQQFVDQYGNPCDRYGNPVVVQQPNPVQQFVDQYSNSCDRYGNPYGVNSQYDNVKNSLINSILSKQ